MPKKTAKKTAKKLFKLNPKGLLKNVAKRRMQQEAAAEGLTLKEYTAKKKKLKGAKFD